MGELKLLRKYRDRLLQRLRAIDKMETDILLGKGILDGELDFIKRDKLEVLVPCKCGGKTVWVKNKYACNNRCPFYERCIKENSSLAKDI